MVTKLTKRSFKLLPTANPGSLFIVWTISFPLRDKMKKQISGKLTRWSIIWTHTQIKSPYLVQHHPVGINLSISLRI